jgi:hypothetical protein
MIEVERHRIICEIVDERSIVSSAQGGQRTIAR